MTPTPPDLGQPEATLAAVSEVSLRLLAGAVSKPTMERLQNTLRQSPSEFPWQVVTQAVLAEPVDAQRLVHQGLAAQRDWIARGGRETPTAPIAYRAKTLLARICAQLIFGALFTLVLLAVLLLLKHKMPGFDIYRILTWFQQLFGAG